MNPKEKFAARKQELFTQITALIAKEGYANLTVRGICQNLSISTGTFYHYFPEKGDLARVLFSDIDEYFTNEVVPNLVEDEQINLINYCLAYGAYVIKGGAETCRCISVAPLNNRNHNYLDETRSIFQILHDILIRGVSKNQFNLPCSTLEAAQMLMVILRGYSADWAKRDGNYDLTGAIQTFIHLFCKSLIK